MRLIVTRPETDAAELKAQLIGMGHDVLVEPMLKVSYHEIDPEDVDLAEAQALIATSRNGIRALARSKQATLAVNLPLFAVGPGTGATARALGFGEVVQGPSDADALVEVVSGMAEVNAGPLVYLAGEVKASDVGGELRRFGFQVQEPIVYSVQPLAALSAGTVSRIGEGEVDGVILMSPQTARIYARLIVAQDLATPARRIMHFCLSANVARGLAVLGACPTAVADQPNLKSLLAKIARGVINLP